MLPHGSSTDVIGITLGYLGMITAIGLFLTPLETMHHIALVRDIEGFSEIPYVASWATCALWIAYGVATPGRLLPLMTNIFGFFMQSMYCRMCFVYSASDTHERIKTRWLISGGFGLFVVATAFLLQLSPGSRDLLNGDSAATLLLGICASVLNIFTYAGPLAAAGQVIKTHSVKFMPLSLTMMTLLCSVAWFMYAVYLRDFFIGIPNALGVILALLQVVVFVGRGRVIEAAKAALESHQNQSSVGTKRTVIVA
jgi:solute carrier family 50 protein (sugar transporter)